MVCLTCHRPTSGRLCAACSATLRPAPERVLPGGLRVVAPFAHEGAARELVHLLKYRGVTVHATLVAAALADRLPRHPLVPVPRSLSRRLRYGVDPSRVIATELARRLRVPVLDLLRPPLHARRRAGRNRAADAPGFTVRRFPAGPVILVDDVVTTGTTLIAAATALGWGNVITAVVANSAPVPSLSARETP